MGKCVVCNKSAGPFYSLHKACYPVYEDAIQCLQQTFSDAVKSAIGQSRIKEAIYACRPSSAFSLNLFETLTRRVWQEQATRLVKSKSLNPEYANTLLDIAKSLGLEDRDVTPYLFLRLSNIEHLACIQQGRVPSKSFPVAQDKMNMESTESLIWMFEGVREVGQKRHVEHSKWSLLQSILNNLFRKSRYRERIVEVQAQGSLTITDQNIYYVSEQGTTKLGLADIYAITPLADGVRIQPVYKDSTSSTYITGDGRFTYALLRYVQGQG